jgi:uncharacterized damage-inducible protein DinB
MNPLRFSTLILFAAGLPAFAQLPAGLRGDVIKELDAVEKKFVGLAQAMPQEKYTWRPAEKVRSVSEVFVHIAGANFMIPAAIGIKPPAGLTRDMEKTITDKTQVVAKIQESFAHLRKGVMDTPDSDLDKPIKLFGRDSTVRGALFIMSNHLHEHLGQSIAYARTNGVTPPWSMGGAE